MYLDMILCNCNKTIISLMDRYNFGHAQPNKSPQKLMKLVLEMHHAFSASFLLNVTMQLRDFH